MCEGLFRGKIKNDGEWVIGSLIKYDNYCCILNKDMFISEKPSLDPESGNFSGNATPVIPETVSEYTGLKDKNGRMIFEGDIIQENSGDYRLLCELSRKKKSHKGIVKFGRHEVPADDPFCWGEAYGFYLDGDVFTPAISSYGTNNEFELEVIGNIYDNPNLIKRKRGKKTG